MPKEKGDKPIRRSFIKALIDRRWKKITTGIFIFVIAALILIPFGIRYGIKRLITANGGDTARIEDVDFNPFTGRVALNGLRIKVNQEQHLKIADAEVRLRWWPLFKKRVRVKRIWLNDTEMTIESLPEGRYRLGGVIAALLEGSQEPTAEKESSPWGVGVQEVTIENTRVSLRMGDFESKVYAKKWTIGRAFSWQPEETAKVTFDGEINDSPIQISAEVTPFAKDRRMNAKLALDGLKIAPFNSLLKNAGVKAEGAASIEADLKMTQKEGGGFTLNHDGSIKLQHPGVKSAELEAAADALIYDGTLAASLPPESSHTLNIEANGKLGVTGLSAVTEGNQVNEDELSWQGKLTAAINSQTKQLKAVVDGDLDSQKLKAVIAESDLTAGHSGFSWKGKAEALLKADHTAINLDGAFAINGAQAASEALNLEQGSLSWKGRVDLNVPKAATGLSLKVDGELDSQKLKAVIAESDLTAGHSGFSWKGKVQALQKADHTAINLDGAFAINGAQAASETLNLEQGSFSWKGRVDLNAPKAATGLSLKTDGRMESRRFDFKLPVQKINGRHEGLQWDGVIEYRAEENDVQIDLNGNLNFDALAFESPDLAAAEKRIEWDGRLKAFLPKSEKTPGLQLNGRLDLGELDLALRANQLAILQESLTWEGPLAFGEVQDQASASGTGKLRLQNLQVTDIDKSYLLMAGKEITVDALRLLNSTGISGNTLRISGLEALKSQRAGTKTALVAARSISVQEFKADPQKRIDIKTITIDSLKSLLARDNKGNWSFSKGLALLSPPQKAGQVPEKAAGKKDQPEISVGKIEIRGNSRVTFEDKSVTPAYKTQMALNTLLLENFDTARAGQKCPFKLAGKIDKYTDINFDGTLLPFADRLTMDLEGEIDNLELPPLSPYIVKAIGYKFASGQADADLQMSVNNGKMDGQTQFVFEQIRAKAVDAQTLEKLDIKQTIPMETALSLLRDSEGDIKLKVPISGDVANPKFSVGDAINQALLKATTKASLTYLKYALGPYGIAIAAAEVAYMAASKAGGIRLEPVKFAPGKSDIDSTAQGYMEKLAAILKDRPEAEIRVCGLAAQATDPAGIQARAAAEAAKTPAAQEEEPPADEAEEDGAVAQESAPLAAGTVASKAQLEALAKARADVIKDYLVSRHGIKADRILICHPEVDKSADGQPRAEILF